VTSRVEDDALPTGGSRSCAAGPRGSCAVEADVVAALAIAAVELLDAHEWSIVERSIGAVFRRLREVRAHRETAIRTAELSAAQATLTAHQTRVLRLVAEGKTYKEIGTALGRSWRTVNNTVEKLRVKFKVASRGELVAEAMRLGALDMRDRTGGSASV